MKSATKLPSYHVEFLPVERRLLDRRNLGHHPAFSLRERRKLDRRLFSADYADSN